VVQQQGVMQIADSKFSSANNNTAVW